MSTSRATAISRSTREMPDRDFNLVALDMIMQRIAGHIKEN